MYIKNTGKLYQLNQISGLPDYVPKRGYTTMGKPQAYATKMHNWAMKYKASYVPDYPWLDLNNFEIIEYEIIEKCRHKHPLAV